MKKYYEKADIKEIYTYISKKFKIQKKSFLLFSVLFFYSLFYFITFSQKLDQSFEDSHTTFHQMDKT